MQPCANHRWGGWRNQLTPAWLWHPMHLHYILSPKNWHCPYSPWNTPTKTVSVEKHWPACCRGTMITADRAKNMPPQRATLPWWVARPAVMMRSPKTIGIRNSNLGPPQRSPPQEIRTYLYSKSCWLTIINPNTRACLTLSWVVIAGGGPLNFLCVSVHPREESWLAVTIQDLSNREHLAESWKIHQNISKQVP